MVAFTDALRGLVRGGYLAGGPKGELVALGRDKGVVPVLQSALTAPTTVSNSNAEVVFGGAYTIPANTLRAGSRIKITTHGLSTSHNSTDTLAIKLYLGGTAGTALVSMAAAQASVNNVFWAHAEVLIRTVGTAGTFICHSLAPAANNAQATALLLQTVASTAIDTTTSKDIAVSATFSVASTANVVQLDNLTVEIT